jgi:transposase-like protein
VLDSGFENLMKTLEEDRELLCGPRRRWQPGRQAYRYGYDEGRLVFGGRKVRVPKPRVRSIGGRELELPSWRHFAEEDPLQHRVLEQMLVGVSSRNYARSLEEAPEGLPCSTTSRSSVSRQFVARTRRQVEEFLSHPLGELDLRVIFMDGTRLGEHVLVTALGIDSGGHKHVLGVVEGSTESEAVCRALLGNLVERGLVVERARLFVIDGGKGLRKAIREVFGAWALIQRCQIHKVRNVLEHLPKGKGAWVRAAMRRAWAAGGAEGARRKLRELASQLQEQHPGATSSLLEGLEETLTLLRLGVGALLAQTLRSTNPVENLQESLKRVARNVKRWRGGLMALRWAASGLMEASKGFRRVKGYRDMPLLIAALESMVRVESVDKNVEVA